MEASSPVASAPPTSDGDVTQATDTSKPGDVSMKEAPSATAGQDEEQAHTAEAPTTNGDVEHKPSEPSEVPGETSQLADDTEMHDASEISAVTDATPSTATAPANGTPVSTKRGGHGGSSKKKSGVPEHKSKKLQKKKSRPMTNLDAEPGQYYFARMKGHPPWPSIICDEEMLPVSLLTTRPVTARLSDGSYKKPEYADGGKRAHERTFPVMFLHTNEFAWIPNTELTPLDPEDESIKTPVEKGKSKTLILAYSKAAEGNDLLHYKTMLADHQKALAEDQAEREERAAKKAKKSSRKSTEAAPTAEDEMDVDEEESSAKPKSKKRKKAEESDAEEKPAKTPKTATKLKLSEPKTPADSASKKKATKPKVKAPKSSSEDDAAGSKAEEMPMTPEAALGMKERKVLYFRHKLQRSMLNRDSMPKEEEMKPMSEFLTELETYPDLEASIIRKTKIHKVLKNIIKLNNIPLEEEFHFKDRSRDLLAKWTEILNNDPSGGAGEGADDKADDKADDPKADSSAPVTNGATAGSAEKATKESKEASEPATASETEPKEDIEKKIGTTVEGDKEAEEPAAETKAQETKETAAEKSSDGPAIDSKPEAEYKPPASTELETESTA